MRFFLIGFLCCAALIFQARGQSPQGINYQGVARDAEGKPLASRDIAVRINILKDGSSGDIEFAETHIIKTNSFGLFMLVIGKGKTTSGSFEFISWAVGNKWLQIELDPAGGNSFQLMGSQQLMSVPYAYYSTYSGNGLTAGQGIKIQNNQVINTGDADNNASNETITDLTFTNKKLRVTEAGVTKEVDLSSLADAGQNLSAVLAAGNNAGGQKITNLATPSATTDAATKQYVDSHSDADGDIKNEIQALIKNGNTLTLSRDPSTVDLAPYLDNTDNQTLSLAGNILNLTNAATPIDLSLFLDNTDNQDLSLTGNTLSLTNDATSINLSSYLDNTDSQTISIQSVDANTRSIAITGGNTLNVDVRDADASITNEIQDLSLIGNTLSLSSDGTTVNLAPYLDNTDNQDLSLTGNTLSLTNDATSINLSTYLDNTDGQTISTQSVDANTRSIAITGGNALNVDVRDADASTTNEIQDLSLIGNTLSLSSDGTTVNLAPYLDNTDNQDLSLTGNTLSLTNDATSINLSTYLDNTDGQTISTQSVDPNTRSIAITGGNALNVDVRDADASTTNEIQDLSLIGNTLSLSSDGTTVNLASYLDNTDNQDLTLTGNTLSLTNDASPINLSPYLDNTDNQDLTLTGNTLALANDATAVNLAPYLQTLTYAGATNTLSISGGNNVAITTTLNQVLSTSADANAHAITNLAAPTNNNDAATKKYVDDADALLSSRISTTYAFKTAFAYSNTSRSIVNDQQLPFTTEEFDDFNVLGGNLFTATENGTYVFVLDGSYATLVGSGAQLSLLYNSVKYSVALVQPWGASGARFNATFMFKLTVGQTVRLVGDNIPSSSQFTGDFFGYKL